MSGGSPGPEFARDPVTLLFGVGAGWSARPLGAQGCSLVGGRLQPDPTGGVAAQFMFDAAAGQRLTLFVRRNPAAADTACRCARQDGIGRFHRIDRGFRYAPSGELPRDAMLSVATAVHRQINP